MRIHKVCYNIFIFAILVMFCNGSAWLLAVLGEIAAYLIVFIIATVAVGWPMILWTVLLLKTALYLRENFEKANNILYWIYAPISGVIACYSNHVYVEWLEKIILN